MNFSSYLYFALLFSAIGALPSAALTFPKAVAHYYALRVEGKEVATAGAAILVSLGVTLHAFSELLYKSGRIIQYFNDVETLAGATIILDIAAILGIGSLSLAVHYLNQTRGWYVNMYWAGQAVLFAWLMLF